MRYSYQKEYILKILKNSKKHYSAEEIHTKVTEVIPKVSLMTVYRNLNKLVQEGNIFPFHIGNVQHFCGNVNLHSHLHCINCGIVVDKYFKDKFIDQLLNKLDSEQFKPLHNGILIRGFCKNCAPHNKTKQLPKDVGYRYGLLENQTK